MTRLSDPVGDDLYDQRDERGQRQHEADQLAWEARTEGGGLSNGTRRRLRELDEQRREQAEAEADAHTETLREASGQ